MAVGGSLGKDRQEMLDMLSWLMPLLPRNKPNHLLGIADPESCASVVPLGVDTMDSCNPTRVARHGTLLTTQGDVRISATKYQNDHTPIDPQMESIPYTRAYLHHLFKQNEPLALTLASLHNIYYMNHLMRELRGRIMRDEI
jgi:queuine tRNA-ribosyltransferase